MRYLSAHQHESFHLNMPDKPKPNKIIFILFLFLFFVVIKMFTLITELNDEIYDDVILSNTKVYDGVNETTYTELVLNVSDENQEYIKIGDKEIPKYIHFSILILNNEYDEKRSELDCKILSKLSKNNVTNTKIVDIIEKETPIIKIEFYLEEGTPFWIDPNNWSLFTSYLEENDGYSLFSTDILTHLLLKIKPNPSIKQIGNLEIWKIKTADKDEIIYEYQDLWDYFESTNTKVIDTYNFTENEYDIFLEILELYEIKTFKYNTLEIDNFEDYYFIFDDHIFNLDWIKTAIYTIVNERAIPTILFSFNKIYDKNKIINSYISSFKMNGYLYKYNEPIISYLDTQTFVRLQIDSRKVYNKFIENLDKKIEDLAKPTMKALKPIDGIPYFKIVYSNASEIKFNVNILYSNGEYDFIFTDKVLPKEYDKIRDKISSDINSGVYLSDWSKVYQYITGRISKDIPLI